MLCNVYLCHKLHVLGFELDRIVGGFQFVYDISIDKNVVDKC